MRFVVLPRFGRGWDNPESVDRAADHIRIGDIALDPSDVTLVEALDKIPDRCWVSHSPEFGVRDKVEVGLSMIEVLALFDV